VGFVHRRNSLCCEGPLTSMNLNRGHNSWAHFERRSRNRRHLRQIDAFNGGVRPQRCTQSKLFLLRSCRCSNSKLPRHPVDRAHLIFVGRWAASEHQVSHRCLCRNQMVKIRTVRTWRSKPLTCSSPLWIETILYALDLLDLQTR
jgi:hypothetical protein